MNATCDSIVLVVIGSTNILEDTHRGENQRSENSRRNQTRALSEDVCVWIEHSKDAG